MLVVEAVGIVSDSREEVGLMGRGLSMEPEQRSSLKGDLSTCHLAGSMVKDWMEPMLFLVDYACQAVSDFRCPSF